MVLLVPVDLAPVPEDPQIILRTVDEIPDGPGHLVQAPREQCQGAVIA